MPERATAAPFGTINALSLAGHRTDGRRWVMFSFFGGGLGGNPVSDGLNHGNAPISTATIRRRDPGGVLPGDVQPMGAAAGQRGAGRHRGGLGAVYEIELLEQEADVFLLASAAASRRRGDGGGPAALNRFSWNTDQARRRPAARLQDDAA